MEVDDSENTEGDATEEDVPQEGEGNMDLDEDFYLHLPRLEIAGDKPVSYLLATLHADFTDYDTSV